MTVPAVSSATARTPSGGAVEVPWNLTVPLADIYLVGYGNRLPNDFTLEMLAALKRCRRVFAAPPLHAPELGLAPMESLMALYRGRRRAEIYHEMAETILAAATDEGPVGFGTYGSAMVGMPVCHHVLARAPERGLTVHVSAAPSALDAIAGQLTIDPLKGVEIWDATAFMVTADVPNTCANLLLTQVGLMERPGEPVVALRDRLLRHYDPDHVVRFVTAPSTGSNLSAADTEALPLRDLVRGGRAPLSTLLVPAHASAADDLPAARGRARDHTERRAP